MKRPGPDRPRGAALPLVLLLLLALVPAVFVFSNLSRVEVVRTRRSQSGLLAMSLAEEGLELLRSGLETGSVSLVSSGVRPHGRFEAYLYGVAGRDSTRKLLYAVSKGTADDVVRILLTTLEVVEPPRVGRGTVIPHDSYVFYTDRDLSTPPAAEVLIQERSPLIATRVENLIIERRLSDSAFANKLESLKGYVDSEELSGRWSSVKAALRAGRSRP